MKFLNFKFSWRGVLQFVEKNFQILFLFLLIFTIASLILNVNLLVVFSKQNEALIDLQFRILETNKRISDVDNKIEQVQNSVMVVQSQLYRLNK